MQEGLYRLETLMAIIYLATIGTLATTLQARYKRLRAGCKFRADLAMSTQCSILQAQGRRLQGFRNLESILRLKETSLRSAICFLYACIRDYQPC